MKKRPSSRAAAEALAVKAVEACPDELLQVWQTYGCKAMKGLVRAARALRASKAPSSRPDRAR